MHGPVKSALLILPRWAEIAFKPATSCCDACSGRLARLQCVTHRVTFGAEICVTSYVPFDAWGAALLTLLEERTIYRAECIEQRHKRESTL